MLKLLGMPVEASTHAAQIDNMIVLVHWLMAVLFVGWGIYFVYVLFRFRRGANPTASYEGAHGKTAKYVEVARAYGLDPEVRAGIFHRVLQENSTDEDWLFETPEDDEWSFRLCAGDRVVECLARDWTPLIKGIRVPGKGRFLYPMFVGREKGQWVIVR